mgnify:CR=1 FL=1
MILTLHFHVDLFAEQAGRLDDQHNDQNNKHDGIGQLGGDVSLAEVFDDTQQDTAQESTGDGADGGVVVTSAMVIYLLNSKMDNSAKITWMVVVAIAPVVGIKVG